jgi:hypothetical protein
VSGRIANFAVGLDGTDFIKRCPAGAGDKLPDPLWVCFATRILRGESFLNVVVTCDRHVNPVLVEDLEQAIQVRAVAVFTAGAEKRVVPVGERA